MDCLNWDDGSVLIKVNDKFNDKWVNDWGRVEIKIFEGEEDKDVRVWDVGRIIYMDNKIIKIYNSCGVEEIDSERGVKIRRWLSKG